MRNYPVGPVGSNPFYSFTDLTSIYSHAYNRRTHRGHTTDVRLVEEQPIHVFERKTEETWVEAAIQEVLWSDLVFET